MQLGRALKRYTCGRCLFRLRAARSYTSGSTHHRSVDLEQMYAEILRSSVARNLGAVQAYLSAHESHDSPPDGAAQRALHGLVDAAFPVADAIRRLARAQNGDYHAVSARRRAFARFRAPLGAYGAFLTQLYPAGGRAVRCGPLYESYCALPTPRPLHVGAEHLEDLVSALMGPREENDAARAVFGLVLGDVEQAGLPVSRHERNAALSMAVREYYQDAAAYTRQRAKEGIKTDAETLKLSAALRRGPEEDSEVPPILDNLVRLYEKVEQEPGEDISTVNILYRFALATEDEELAGRAAARLRSGAVAADRITFLVELMRAGRRGRAGEVRQLYAELRARRLVVDVVVVNVLLKALLSCGDREGAERLFHAVLAQEAQKREVETQREDVPEEDRVAAYESIAPAIRGESRHMNQLRLLDLVEQIAAAHSDAPPTTDGASVQGAVRIVPDKYTFGTLFGYYCLEAGDAGAALELLPAMRAHGLALAEAHYVALFRGFARHRGNGWTRELLKQVTQELQQRADATLFTRRVCGSMLAAYAAVHWERAGDVRAVREVYVRGLRPATSGGGMGAPVSVAALVQGAVGALLSLP